MTDTLTQTNTAHSDRYTVQLRTSELPFPNLNLAATACGLSPSALWRTVHGESAPSAQMIGTLLRVTGKSFDELFDVVPAKRVRRARQGDAA